MPKLTLFSRLLNSVVLIVFFNLYSISVYAEQHVSEKPPSFWTLIIKPRICVKSVTQSVCEMQTHISWTAQAVVNACLLSSEKNSILKCWDESVQGSLFQNVVSDKKVTFWLSRLGEDEVLVKAIVRVVTVPKKGVRQRRRHIWSLL